MDLCELEASLVYRTSSRTTRLHNRETLSPTNKQTSKIAEAEYNLHKSKMRRRLLKDKEGPEVFNMARL